MVLKLVECSNMILEDENTSHVWSWLRFLIHGAIRPLPCQHTVHVRARMRARKNSKINRATKSSNLRLRVASKHQLTRRPNSSWIKLVTSKLIYAIPCTSSSTYPDVRFLPLFFRFMFIFIFPIWKNKCKKHYIRHGT